MKLECWDIFKGAIAVKSSYRAYRRLAANMMHLKFIATGPQLKKSPVGAFPQCFSTIYNIHVF